MPGITQTELNQILEEAETDLLLKSDIENIKTLESITKISFKVKGQNIIIQGDKELLGIRRIQHSLLYCDRLRTCKVFRRNREIKIYIQRKELSKFELTTLVELTYLDIKQQY